MSFDEGKFITWVAPHSCTVCDFVCPLSVVEYRWCLQYPVHALSNTVCWLSSVLCLLYLQYMGCTYIYTYVIRMYMYTVCMYMYFCSVCWVRLTYTDLCVVTSVVAECVQVQHSTKFHTTPLPGPATHAFVHYVCHCPSCYSAKTLSLCHRWKLWKKLLQCKFHVMQYQQLPCLS